MDDRLRRSRKQEKGTAKRFGGWVTPMSGAGCVKNDVVTDFESIELKATAAKQFTLKLDDLQKAGRIALLASKRMVFGIEFGTGDSYVVLEENDYLALTQRASER